MRMTAAGICLVSFVATAGAQDIAGLEDCTRTSGLDKRTGCFQSNIDYLSRQIVKNAAQARQDLNAAKAEIVALKSSLVELTAKVEQLQAAARKPEEKKAKRGIPIWWQRSCVHPRKKSETRATGGVW